MNHLELIVKNGTVKIPSIFLFEHSDDVEQFLSYAKKAKCTVIFDNEDLTISPDKVSSDIRAKLDAYYLIVDCREIGNSYARCLLNVSEMTWDKVQITKPQQMSRDEVIQMLIEGQAEHEEMMEKDPEYRALWERREKAFDKVGLFDDSIPF